MSMYTSDNPILEGIVKLTENWSDADVSSQKLHDAVEPLLCAIALAIVNVEQSHPSSAANLLETIEKSLDPKSPAQILYEHLRQLVNQYLQSCSQ